MKRAKSLLIPTKHIPKGEKNILARPKGVLPLRAFAAIPAIYLCQIFLFRILLATTEC